MFVSAANVVPFALTAWTVRALTWLPQRGVVAVVTNVHGPRHRLPQHLAPSPDCRPDVAHWT